MHIWYSTEEGREVAMEELFAQEVYDTLEGNLRIPVAGVEDAFSAGSVCDREYTRMLDAYEHLKERLAIPAEDEDIEGHL